MKLQRVLRFTERCVLLLAASALVWGQGPGPMHRDGPGDGRVSFQRGGPRPQPLGGPGGKWWANPEMVKRLAITPDQLKKMDDVLQQSRLRLIDLNATLEKEEVMMEGLMRGPQLDDSKILPAVDRIAQARAELEKANARLMLGIRHVLTPEQWEKLQSEGPREHHPGPGPGMGGPDGGGPRRPGPGGPSPRSGKEPNGPPPAGPREE